MSRGLFVRVPQAGTLIDVTATLAYIAARVARLPEPRHPLLGNT